MRHTTRILAFLMFLSPVIHAQPDSVFHASFAKRWNYVRSIGDSLCASNDKKAFFFHLDELIENAKKHDDPALAFQLNCLRYWLQESISVSNYKKEIAYLSDGIRKGYEYEATDGLFNISLWLWDLGMQTEAVETALSAYNIYKGSNPVDFPPLTKYQHQLAIQYFDFNKYDRAKQLLLELTTGNADSAYVALGSFTNTLALIYREEKKYDSAICYLRLLYDDKLNLVGPDVRTMAAGNIGRTYLIIDEYDSALKWLNYELKVNRSDKNKKRQVFSSYVAIAGAHLKKGDVKAALTYIDSANQYKTPQCRLNHIKAYYQTAAQILNASGKPGKALAYMDSVLLFTDSIAKQTDLTKLQNAENKIARARNEAEIMSLEYARDKSLWIRNFAIALIVFVAIVTILLINRSRMRHKERELRLENEKNTAENELAHFTLKLSERNQRLTELEEEIRELGNEQEITAKNEIINELRQSTILTDEEWDKFRVLFEKVHSGYIQKVKDTYDDLTPAELRYITLTKLGMTNKEMANVLGISTNTVRNYKFRLRKKFDLPEEEDLDKMIRGIK
ncbi:MAG: hypothetical protein KF744_12070 [Taibaiella sp.]|nr:hypothetical protein [Taibaiella sp.]